MVPASVLRAVLLAIVSAREAPDLCSMLCHRDVNCTSGSWEERGFCRSYFFLPNTESRAYCYRDPGSAAWCLDTFQQVAVRDVPRLLTGRMAPVVAPKPQRIDGIVEMGPMLAEAIIQLKGGHPISEWSRVGGRPIDAWEGMAGPHLLRLAGAILNDPLVDEETRFGIIQALLVLGTNLFPKSGIRWFVEESGLGKFCEAHALVIQEFLLAKHRNWLSVTRRAPTTTERSTVSLLSGIAANLVDYCPSVLSNTRLREISLLHRVLREVLITDTASAGPMVIFKVRRSAAFEDSVGLLTAPLQALRSRLVPVFDVELGLGEGVEREWFLEVTAQMYNPAYGLFERKAESPHYTVISRMAEFQDDSTRWFTAVGRFLGLSIWNDNPVGVTFPVMFYAHILGVELQLTDIAADEPELFKSFSEMLGMDSDQLEELQLEMEINREVTPVTLENRDELIKRKINSLIRSHSQIHDRGVHFAHRFEGHHLWKSRHRH